MLSFESGTATPFALTKVQERGALFSAPGDEVYEDQIIGIHAKENDLKVNVCKAKQLTNMRSAGADEKASTTPPMQARLIALGSLLRAVCSYQRVSFAQLTLEDAVEYIVAGEFVEVTPEAIRMGKFPKESRFAKK